MSVSNPVNSNRQLKVYIKKVENGIGVRCINCITGADNFVIITSKPKHSKAKNELFPKKNMEPDEIESCSKPRRLKTRMMVSNKGCIFIWGLSKKIDINQILPFKRNISLLTQNKQFHDETLTMEKYGSQTENTTQKSSYSGLPPKQKSNEKGTQTRKHYILRRTKDENTSAGFSIEQLYQSPVHLQFEKETQTERIYCLTQTTQTTSVFTLDWGTQTDVVNTCNGITYITQLNNETNSRKVEELGEFNKLKSGLLGSYLIESLDDESSSSPLNISCNSDSSEQFSQIKHSQCFLQSVNSKYIKDMYTNLTLTIADDQNHKCNARNSNKLISLGKNDSILTLFNNVPNYKTNSHSSQNITDVPTLHFSSDGKLNSNHFEDRSGESQNVRSSMSYEIFTCEYQSLKLRSSNSLHSNTTKNNYLSKTTEHSRTSSQISTATRFYDFTMSDLQVKQEISEITVNRDINKETEKFFLNEMSNKKIKDFNEIANESTKSNISRTIKEVTADTTLPTQHLCDCCGLIYDYELEIHECCIINNFQSISTSDMNDMERYCEDNYGIGNVNKKMSLNAISSIFNKAKSIPSSQKMFKYICSKSNHIYDKISSRVKPNRSLNRSNHAESRLYDINSNEKLISKQKTKNHSIRCDFCDESRININYGGFIQSKALFNTPTDKCTSIKSLAANRVLRENNVLDGCKAEAVHLEGSSKSWKAFNISRVASIRTSLKMSRNIMFKKRISEHLSKESNVNFKNKSSYFNITKKYFDVIKFNRQICKSDEINDSSRETLHLVPSSLKFGEEKVSELTLKSKASNTSTTASKKSQYFGIENREMITISNQTSAVRTNKALSDAGNNKRSTFKKLKKIPRIFCKS